VLPLARRPATDAAGSRFDRPTATGQCGRIIGLRDGLNSRFGQLSACACGGFPGQVARNGPIAIEG
jgi:hypothetical protein